MPARAFSSFPCDSAAFAELTTGFLREGTAVRFRARGTSMHPLVRDGDVVLVRPVEPGSVRTGDLLLFIDRPDRVVVHRVIRKWVDHLGSHYWVQGDQVARPDEVVGEAQVLGKVAAIDRGNVRIHLDRPAMHLLGRLAVWRARSKLGYGRSLRPLKQILRRLPVLRRYLL